MSTPWRLAGADRERFRTVAAALGAPGPEAWLSEVPKDPEPCWPLLACGPTRLGELGRRELAGLLAWLERGPRAALAARVRETAGRGLPHGSRRLPGWALHSLRATLLGPPRGAPDFIERAGLHRLARALADRPLPAEASWPVGFDGGARQILRAAHAWLSGLPAARLEAPGLRRACGWGR